MSAITHDNIDVLIDGRRLVLSEEDTSQSLFHRLVTGGFFLLIGAMILWLFLSGGGPSLKQDLPVGRRVLTIGLIGLMFVGLGVVPLCLGLGTIFVRRRFVLDAERSEMEVRDTVLGVTLRQRNHPLRQFSSVKVERRRVGGGFVSRIVFVVECWSEAKCEELVWCGATSRASDIAGRIAQYTGLPCVENLQSP